jgi:hypothetical protein
LLTAKTAPTNDPAVREEAAVSAPVPQAIDVLDLVATPSPEPEARMVLGSGRVVEARRAPGAEDRLTIRAPSGEVELEVRMTPEGPVLRFRAADVELDATRDVRVSCDRFHVRAKSGIVEETGGDLVQRVNGDAAVEVHGKHSTTAREVAVEAKRGNVKIEANDDVDLVGERVRLNC